MKKMIMAISGLALAVNVASALPTLTGSLAFGSGIYATPNWNNAGTWLSWNIYELAGGDWRYEYVWHTDGRDLSHIIIEVTEGAIREDFWQWDFQHSGVEATDTTPGWFGPHQGNSNPGMPGSLYGISLNLTADTPVFGFSFTTWRSPVWGDFYAKDGKYGGSDVLAYNTGFLLEDQNDGWHIARPNGASTGDNPPPPVSDGGLTLSLLGLALAGLGMIRRHA